MKRAPLFVLGASLVGGGVVAALRIGQPSPASTPISTGKFLTPLDPGVEVGNYPANLAMSPDGKYVVVTDTGYREQISLIDTSTGQVVSKLDFNRGAPKKEGLYFGLAFYSNTEFFVSRGREDKLSAFEIKDGKLDQLDFEIPDPSSKANEPNYLGGIALSNSTIYVAHNETYPGGSGMSAVAAIDRGSGGKVIANFPAHGFPLDVKIAGGKIFSSSERDGIVDVLKDGGPSPIKVGKNPSYMLASADGQLWVSNSGSDTVSLIDPVTETVKKTILVRPAEVRGLPSCMPLGMAEFGGDLFVACGDLNAVAVIDEKSGKLRGYLPVGWLPTSLAITPDGKRMFVANAKGTKTRTPNGKPVTGKGTYVLSVLEGTVSMIELPAALASLPDLSKQVVANNRYDQERERTVRQAFKNPGIKHVIYVIKENRTYDNLLGDMKEANGDPSICLFPEEVTPNQHALARRFVLLDNFSVCAEVSADGWNWSTSGMVNEYTSRNVPVNYSGRGRSYDQEGATNGEQVDLEGKPDVAEAPGGYIWDLCKKHGVSMRNYGFFVGETDAAGALPGSHQTRDTPVKKNLQGITDTSYREFDMEYPDSQALEKYNFKAPRQMTAFGEHNSSSRFAEWKLEFDEYVKNGKLPKFNMIRLPRDHTSGTSPGMSSPRAMEADNDYGVGQIVEAVSHSLYWQSTVICVLEDDAQAGMDHVDCHRSPALVISPFVKRGIHDGRFYNTDSMLRTMELLLGLPPMNGYDAVADPIDEFSDKLDNAEPYEPILPNREIVCDVNETTSYRAHDSAVMLRRMGEDSMPDLVLNDILWGDFKRHAARR